MNYLGQTNKMNKWKKGGKKKIQEAWSERKVKPSDVSAVMGKHIYIDRQIKDI